jgi:hypothetical protein
MLPPTPPGPQTDGVGKLVVLSLSEVAASGGHWVCHSGNKAGGLR